MGHLILSLQYFVFKYAFFVSLSSYQVDKSQGGIGYQEVTQSTSHI